MGHILPSHGKMMRQIFGNTAFNNIKEYLRTDNKAESKWLLPQYPSDEYLQFMYGDIEGIGNSQEAKKYMFRSDFLNAQNDANNVIKTIMSKLQLPALVDGLRNMPVSTPDNPAEVLAHIFMQTDTADGLDKLVQDQLVIQQLIASEAFKLIYLNRRRERKNELSKFSDWLDEEVLRMPSEPISRTYESAIYSIHNPADMWADKCRLQPFTEDEKIGKLSKRRELAVRKFSLYGNEFTAMVDIRTKGDPEALIKAIAKAIKRQGTKLNKQTNFLGALLPDEIIGEKTDRVSVEEDAIDINGSKIVILEGDKNQFVKLFEAKLKEKYGDNSIRDDSVTGSSRGQSERNKFTRKIVNDAVGTELIVYDAQEFMNSEYHIGKYINESNLFDGAAHDLYELRRIREVAEIVLASRNASKEDIDKYYWKAVIKKVNDLRIKDMID